jgi:predicted ester cyclase
VATWTATGTHRGDFNGLAPTGRRGRVNGCTIYRFKNAKITRSQAFWDAATLLRQLGALPAALEAGRERTTDREVDLRPSA